MNWELLITLGTTGAALLLAFLYARVSVRAAASDSYKAASTASAALLDQARTALAAKETYTRELEKTILGSLTPGKLVERLNLLFSAERNHAPSALPAPVPSPASAPDHLGGVHPGVGTANGNDLPKPK